MPRDPETESRTVSSNAYKWMLSDSEWRDLLLTVWDQMAPRRGGKFRLFLSGAGPSKFVATAYLGQIAKSVEVNCANVGHVEDLCRRLEPLKRFADEWCAKFIEDARNALKPTTANKSARR